MRRLLTAEPALLIGAIQATLALAVAFGLELSAEQVGAIVATTGAVMALVTRQAVVAPATAVRMTRAAATIAAAGGAVEPTVRGVANEVGGLVAAAAP